MKASIILENVIANYDTITRDQRNRCTRYVDENGVAMYMVWSESKPLTTYFVRYNSEHGFTCTCPCGEHGFATVGHPSGVCKHVRWAVASSIEERNSYLTSCEIVGHTTVPNVVGDFFIIQQGEQTYSVRSTPAGNIMCHCDVYLRTTHCPHTQAVEKFHHEHAEWTNTIQ